MAEGRRGPDDPTPLGEARPIGEVADVRGPRGVSRAQAVGAVSMVREPDPPYESAPSAAVEARVAASLEQGRPPRMAEVVSAAGGAALGGVVPPGVLGEALDRVAEVMESDETSTKLLREVVARVEEEMSGR